MNLGRTLDRLKHGNVSLLFLGTSLSRVGDFIEAIARSWPVRTWTASPFVLGVVGMIRALRRLLLGAVGGAVKA